MPLHCSYRTSSSLLAALDPPRRGARSSPGLRGGGPEVDRVPGVPGFTSAYWLEPVDGAGTPVMVFETRGPAGQAAGPLPPLPGVTPLALETRDVHARLSAKGIRGPGSRYSPEPQPGCAQDAGQQDGKQPEPGTEVALITVAEPDVVIRAVGRCYLPALRQVHLPRAFIEGAEHPGGRGRQPPDDRVLHGPYPLPPLVIQELAEPEARPEHAGPGLGAAPELDDEPGPVPAGCIRTARRLNPGDDELLARRPLPDRGGRRPAALKALSGKARPQRSQGLPVNHPVRYHTLHQPTIAKARPPTEAADRKQDNDPGCAPRSQG